MMGTEIFKIDAPWAQKLPKTRVPFLMTPTVLQGLGIEMKASMKIEVGWSQNCHECVLTPSSPSEDCKIDGTIKYEYTTQMEKVGKILKTKQNKVSMLP